MLNFFDFIELDFSDFCLFYILYFLVVFKVLNFCLFYILDFLVVFC